MDELKKVCEELGPLLAALNGEIWESKDWRVCAWDRRGKLPDCSSFLGVVCDTANNKSSRTGRNKDRATLMAKAINALPLLLSAAERVTKLEEALKFYADKKNYTEACGCKIDPRTHAPDEPCHYAPSIVSNDDGDIARTALENEHE